jgi:hypothetical protein
MNGARDAMMNIAQELEPAVVVRVVPNDAHSSMFGCDADLAPVEVLAVGFLIGQLRHLSAEECSAQ